MASADSLHSKLDALYGQWLKLSPTSPEEAYEAFATHFSRNAVAWLLSMRELAEPSIGHDGIIQGIKESVKDAQINERRVVARSASTEGSKIFCETSNRVTVHGKLLDPFPEITVVEFDEEDLITNFKIYSCRSPIVAIVQDVTGVGPYERHTECHCE
ncbi:hypothetical protein BJ170DRAFT_613975 [Xylariales sp. AK1849]|nr:hypothetical protein BJ170DRAFT_613975 [Xylariales sp. AK1849]